MEILTPEKVRNDKQARSNEQGRIAQRAMAVTTKTLKELNDAKDRAAQEREKEEAQTLHEASVAQIKRDALLTEVAALEARKAEALKPIAEMQQAAEILMNDAHGRLQAVTKRETVIANAEIELAEKMDQIQAVADSMVEERAALDQREIRVTASEAITKQSSDQLASKWVEYHTAVNVHNRDVTVREQRVALAEKANEVVRQALAKRTRDLDDRERAITDRYETMLATEREWQQKQHDRRQNRQ